MPDWQEILIALSCIEFFHCYNAMRSFRLVPSPQFLNGSRPVNYTDALNAGNQKTYFPQCFIISRIISIVILVRTKRIFIRAVSSLFLSKIQFNLNLISPLSNKMGEIKTHHVMHALKLTQMNICLLLHENNISKNNTRRFSLKMNWTYLHVISFFPEISEMTLSVSHLNIFFDFNHSESL